MHKQIHFRLMSKDINFELARDKKRKKKKGTQCHLKNKKNHCCKKAIIKNEKEDAACLIGRDE